MRKFTTGLLLSMACMLPALPAAGMTMVRAGSDLFAAGATVDTDYLAFRQALEQPGLERLVLVDAPGGDLWTGMRVARMVQARGLKTVVSGHCLSACSLIFIGGRERAFGTGSVPLATLVGIHGAHNRETRLVDAQLSPQMYALYKQQMGERFDADVIGQALYRIDDAGGFLRLRELQRNREADRTPWFCPAKDTPLARCVRHEGKDAFTLGVVTQRETEAVTLPAGLRAPPDFFGRPLAASPGDLGARLTALTDLACGDREVCRPQAGRALERYLSAPQHRALAVGASSPGYGTHTGAANSSVAMLRALGHCNHGGAQPRLCRIVAVDDHDVGAVYDEVAAAGRAMLPDLPEPAAQAVQAENEEPGSGVPARLRTGAEPGGMTPTRLEGIERVDTGQLRRLMASARPPVLVDVGAGGPMLPGAFNLINAGLAFEDPAREGPFDERFSRMLKLAAPDPDQPMVFYCSHAGCWASANAAMRALRAGYTRVHWYRGGVAAWQAAGMPVTGRAPVAFLY